MPRQEQDARDEAFFLARLEQLMPNVVVGTFDGVIVGFAAWKGAVLGQIFIDAAHRGSGLAQDLLLAAEQGLRAQGVLDAELHCLVGNERAKRFYERACWQMGAVIAERVQGDAGDERRDFWVMRKRLGAHLPRPRGPTETAPDRCAPRR